MKGIALAPALLVALTCGCGGDGGSGESEIVVRTLRPASLAIPPNPTTGAALTEAARSRAIVHRYAQNPGAPVDAILVLVPGTSGGASDFDYMARRLVERSGGRVEVWAFERRSNALEDTTGFEAAERAGDVDLAIDYYLRGRAVEGRSFDGFLEASELGALSEAGLVSVMEDLRAVLALVPEERRATNVFIGGHSLGASQTLLFLSWDFDGDDATLADAGFANVAGGLLLEGSAFGAGGPSVDRDAYAAELAELRDGTTPTIGGFPGITPAVLSLLGLAGMAAHPDFDDPDDPTDGPRGASLLPALPLPPDVEAILNVLVPARVLPALLGTGPSFRDFQLSSRAFLGVVLDEQFQFIGAQQASLGFVSPPSAVAPRTLAGVPVELVGGLFGSSGPSYGLSDPGVFYRWLDYDEVEGIPQTSPGEEISRLERLAELQFAGPSNFSEWYFAVRPSLDADATGNLPTLDPSSWQAAEHGLTGFHAARIDVPLLAIGGGSGLTPSEDSFASVRRTVAGPLEVRIVPGMNHLDVLCADDERAGGNGFFADILEWMLANREGTVTVPSDPVP